MRPLVLFAVLAIAGCSKPPPPAPPPPPEPVKEEPPPPAPPPPPKCEALDEKCAATEATSLIIGEKAQVRPPAGWRYAREAKASVAVSDDGNGFLAFTVAAKDDPESVLAATSTLLERLAVTDVKAPLLKTRLKKPQSTVNTGDGVTVKLWEVDRESHGGTDPKKDGKPGAALIAVTTVGGVVVVGVGYVTKAAASTHVPAIMTAVKTLRGAP
jgi:hypothetical protein